MQSYDVFISYARTSSFDEAHQFAALLTDNGISHFIDDRSIPLGSRFPQDIAKSLLNSRVMVVFVDSVYFERYWCVCEYQLGIALYRKNISNGKVESPLEHMLIALPENTELDMVKAHLPPLLSNTSWPASDNSADLVELVIRKLEKDPDVIGNQLDEFDDNAVKMLLDGGSIPVPAVIKNIPNFLKNIPDGLGNEFIGRQDILWRIFHSLETNGVAGNATTCVLRGLGGTGKTQIAAEYVWRYGARYYPGGIIWLNADCDEEELFEQLYDIALKFLPNIEPVDRFHFDVEAISSRLVDYFSERENDKAVLWVVDNLPEPKKGQRIQPLKYWCPVEQYVRVLGTTRRSKIKVGTLIRVSEFSPEIAIEMITRNEVKKDWLSNDEWKEIVNWVGCLPLALKLLQTLLSEKFIAVKSLLSKAREEEPADYLKDEIDSLQEEVEENYLRGVTETFHLSYALLQNDHEMQSALQFFAFLSFVAVPQPLLTLTISERTLGKLANRSWIQSSESTNDKDSGNNIVRLWQMHRLVSSYVRSQTRQPVILVAMVAEWLTKVFESDLHWHLLKRCNPHLFRLRNNAHHFLIENNPETFEVVSKVNFCGQTVALTRLDDERLDGARYLGACLVYWSNDVDTFLERLENKIAEDDIKVLSNLPHLLQVFRNSQRAANLFVQLLNHSDLEVCRKAMVYVGNCQTPEIVAIPFLEVLINPKHENILDNVINSFENLFTANSPSLDIILPKLIDLAKDGEYQGMVSARLLSRLFAHLGEELVTANFSGIRLANELIEIVKTTNDEKIALQLADGLGRVDSDEIYTQVIGLLSAEDRQEIQLQRIKAVNQYLHIRTYPPTPKIKVEYKEDGGVALHAGEGGFFPTKKARPELNRPLGDFVLKLVHPDIFEQAIEIICQSSVGQFGLVQAVYDVIDAGEYQRVIAVASKAMEYSPDFPSPYMWRSECYEALGQFEKALSDQSMLINMTTNLPEQYRAEYIARRGFIQEQLNNIPGAIEDYSSAIELDSENSQHYQYRGYLYKLANDVEKAFEDFTQAVKLNPEETYSLYEKAMYQGGRGEYALALIDLKKLLAIDKNHHAAWYLQGLCNLNLQLYPPAIESLSNAILLEQNVGEYYYIRGLARFYCDLKDDARRDVELCLQLNPDHGKCQELQNLLEE
ncbi:toll/interleukin-1 receptor domain-containing protein [Aliikangiella coralliicola]|uniref:TIR domain-containing protein n=1 Tax=Aliikangiella coralliicola TaxID=2592383 RepID=A0A545UJL0_9GAMM|nr:toll/interleukin-1 receptor domain-containing protein [Aliikangiella coralliicola]TQV89656.1 TIR domain-containing protein [Aliikangiella coralliicola]